MMKWLFRHEETPHSAPEATLPEGWFTPLPSHQLLASPLRQSLIHQLRQLVALPDPLFRSLYLTPVERYAVLAQQYPASEHHHHAYPGGLLDHSLEVAVYAVRLRQSRLLPPGAPPEEQARIADRWTAAVALAALLHDSGKLIADVQTELSSGERWFPWSGAPELPYRLRYLPGRDYHLHPVAAGCLLPSLLPEAVLRWLAESPELFAAFLYALTGHPDKSGAIGELVQQADCASVSASLGGDINTALNQPRPALPQQCLIGIRWLLQHELALNRQACGSDGWLTDDALWLVSKTCADKLRAWLLQHGVSGVPDNNSRLFDELLAQRLLLPNGDRAIWRCDIRDATGWTPGTPLTLLKLSPATLWPDVSLRPHVFHGEVIPEMVSGNTNGNADDDCELLPQDAPAIPDQGENVTTENPFFTWLKAGIATGSLTLNAARSLAHLVDGKLFLVSPGIFKQYHKETRGDAGDKWTQTQKGFQKLKLHLRGEDGINIWNCTVKGPRSTRTLRGYLLSDAATNELTESALIADNPFLRLEKAAAQEIPVRHSDGPATPEI